MSLVAVFFLSSSVVVGMDGACVGFCAGHSDVCVCVQLGLSQCVYPSQCCVFELFS